MADATHHGMKVTDEASAEGLRLAREAGRAYQRMVAFFIDKVADAGQVREAGQYRIGVAVEKAEPLWRLRGASLELHDPPASANQHLEVIVTDVDDGRFIPDLEVTATLIDDDGHEVGTWDLPFLWHPTMFHYGRNVAIPRSGRYRLRVSIPAPSFGRHDRLNGRRYGKAAVVEFDDLDLHAARENADGDEISS